MDSIREKLLTGGAVRDRYASPRQDDWQVVEHHSNDSKQPIYQGDMNQDYNRCRHSGCSELVRGAYYCKRHKHIPRARRDVRAQPPLKFADCDHESTTVQFIGVDGQRCYLCDDCQAFGIDRENHFGVMRIRWEACNSRPGNGGPRRSSR